MIKNGINKGLGDGFLLQGIGKKPFNLSEPIREKRGYTIGKFNMPRINPPLFAGVDIVKPPSLQNSPKLTDKEKTELLAKQIADSIQARIDKARLEEIENQKAKDEESQKTSRFSPLLIIGTVLVGGLLIFIAYKHFKPKLKTVIA